MDYEIHIPEDLRGCHQIITRTREEKLHPPKAANLYSEPERVFGILDLQVSKNALPRALRLLEAIICTCEKQGWSVEGNDQKEGSGIRIADDPVTFSVIEQSDRIELPSTKEEKAYSYWRPRFKHENNGRLTIQITDWLPTGMRRTWSDGTKQRLENILGEFLDGVVQASAANKERRLEREQWHRQYEEEQRRREDEARRIKIEHDRRSNLVAQCAGRKNAVAIREMIAEVQKRASANRNEWPAHAVIRWVEWAEALANRADPFANGYFKNALEWMQLDAELDCESRP
jgi:hypothetical protein